MSMFQSGADVKVYSNEVVVNVCVFEGGADVKVSSYEVVVNVNVSERGGRQRGGRRRSRRQPAHPPRLCEWTPALCGGAAGLRSVTGQCHVSCVPCELVNEQETSYFSLFVVIVWTNFTSVP